MGKTVGNGKPVNLRGKPSGMGSLSRKVDMPMPKANVSSQRLGGLNRGQTKSKDH